MQQNPLWTQFCILQQCSYLMMRPTQTTFLVNWDKKQTADPWMIDIFAGGYGGWSCPLQVFTEDLQKISMLSAYPKHLEIAVERDIPAATSHAHNHDMILLPDETLPHHWFHQHPHSTVINAPIQSHRWKQCCPQIYGQKVIHATAEQMQPTPKDWKIRMA